jgi:predicted nucleic acid-binding protein
MDRKDRDHAVCAELLAENRRSLIVPAPVLPELEWLAEHYLQPSAFDAFLADIADGLVRIADLGRTDYARVRQLCHRYRDLPLGFVDASVIAIAERLGEHRLATLDRRHFTAVRPLHTPAFVLVPEID